MAASYGLSALTLSMFEMDMSELLGLTFSPRAAGRTVLYFGLIFLLVMLFSGVQVSRAKLIDLIQGDRKNEVLRQRSLTVAVVQLRAGGGLPERRPTPSCSPSAWPSRWPFPVLCVPMLALGTLGTLLIFRSLSGFVLKLVQRGPGSTTKI